MEYFAYSQKAFVYKYVVMLSDTDQFNHMSFANYLKLMFLAGDALFGSCFDQNFLVRNRLKLINSRMQFKKQTVAGDGILIEVNASEIGTSEFTLLHTFIIEGSGDLVGLGRQTYELVNRSTEAQEGIPDRIRDVLIPILTDEEHLLYKY
jgi:acyl-CoA thioesterase FadM